MGSDRIDERRTGPFASFDGYDAESETDASADHDAWGIE